MYDTPQEAETAFYLAIESADLDLMMKVWAADDGVQCIHPMGGRLHGRDEVRTGWQRVMETSGSMRFRVAEVSSTEADDFSIHVLHEHITLVGREAEGESLVVATNIYRNTADGWRMILHHASVAPSRPREETAPPTVVH